MQPTGTVALNDRQHGYDQIINVYLIHTVDLVCMQQSLRACIVNNCLSTEHLIFVVSTLTTSRAQICALLFVSYCESQAGSQYSEVIF